MKQKARRTVTFVAAAAAVLGAAAWFKINQDNLDEYFAAFADLFRYVSFHRR